MRITAYIPDEIHTIGIIGTSKNAGKTTLLNHLIREYHELHRRIGIVSVGVDGEKHDAWSGLPKPPILVAPDMLVATSRLAIEEADARFEILEKIKDSTLGHEVYLVRTVKGGRVKLAGTPSLHEIKRVLQGFTRNGAEIQLVDGAYDRVATANPYLSEGIILVVGASFHRSLSVITARVRELLFRFTLPTPPVALSPELLQLVDAGKALWVDMANDQVTPLDYPLRAGWTMGLQGKEAFLVVPGSCTSRILQELMRLEPIPAIVVHDGTRLFAGWEDLTAYYRRGGRIYARLPIRLLGIAINPYSPDGYQLDSDEMMVQMKQISGDLPVFDVGRGKMI